MQESRGDQARVQRLRDGEAAAVTELQSVYRVRIYQLAFRSMENLEDAEEVTQDCQVYAFCGDVALSSWIYRITFNTAMSRSRSLKRWWPVELLG